MADFNLKWDQDGERLYETGVDRCVCYPTGGKAEAWNGVTAVTLSPSGAEPNPFYANNRKYLNILSNEEMAFTIEAFTYPDAFSECNGEKAIVPGVKVTQQVRKPFGFTFRNLIGNDLVGNDYGYKIHLLYNCLAAPSEKPNNSLNESPELDPMSWECSTTPINIPGCKPSAHIEIDSTTVNAEELAALEAMLYGSGDTEPKLPTPEELTTLFTNTQAAG